MRSVVTSRRITSVLGCSGVVAVATVIAEDLAAYHRLHELTRALTAPADERTRARSARHNVRADEPSPARRVLIVLASIGAGHAEASAELARRLSAADASVQVVDFLHLAGAAGDRLRTTYRLLLRYAPWLYGSAMWVWARASRAATRVSRLR
jgi:hypothetical protein